MFHELIVVYFTHLLMLHVDVTKNKLSVLCTDHKRNACGLQTFLSRIVFISVEWIFDEVLQCA